MQLILGCNSKTTLLSCLYKGKKIVKYNNWICLSCSNQNASKLENVSNLIATVYLHVYISIYKMYVEKTTENMKEVDFVMISISIINYRL